MKLWRDRYRRDSSTCTLAFIVIGSWLVQCFGSMHRDQSLSLKLLDGAGALACMSLAYVVFGGSRIKCDQCRGFIRAREDYVESRHRHHVECPKGEP